MKNYTVRYERDAESGWWTAQIQEVPAAITQGRTINEARRRVREALSVVLDDDKAASKANLVDEVKLPVAAQRTLERARAARKRLEDETGKAQALTSLAARKLIDDMGLSVRDAGELLGISHQRVQQLMHVR